MKNYVAEGDIITLTAPYARLSGEGALVGSIFGVAVADVANGADGEFKTEGVFNLAKAASQAWAVGARIYWDDTAKVCTNVAATNKHIGVALAVVGAGVGETIGNVRLSASFTL